MFGGVHGNIRWRTGSHERRFLGISFQEEKEASGGHRTFPALNLRRQCPPDLLVGPRFSEGKMLACGICYVHRAEFKQGLYCVRWEVALILTLEGLH